MIPAKKNFVFVDCLRLEGCLDRRSHNLGYPVNKYLSNEKPQAQLLVISITLDSCLNGPAFCS